MHIDNSQTTAQLLSNLDKIQFEFPLKKIKYMYTIQTEKYIITEEMFARDMNLINSCLIYKLECFIEISTTEKNRIWYT